MYDFEIAFVTNIVQKIKWNALHWNKVRSKNKL